jgi:hypothetical protein
MGEWGERRYGAGILISQLIRVSRCEGLFAGVARPEGEGVNGWNLRITRSGTI